MPPWVPRYVLLGWGQRAVAAATGIRPPFRAPLLAEPARANFARLPGRGLRHMGAWVLFAVVHEPLQKWLENVSLSNGAGRKASADRQSQALKVKRCQNCSLV